jgi:predicted dinucleotide-binding enzyme
MQPADTQSLGIIGAGRIGQAMAQIASRAGRTVVIANRHGPQSLASVVTELGDRVSAGTVPANIWGPRCSPPTRTKRAVSA